MTRGEKNTERPSLALERHADEVIALGAQYGITDIQVFGSCVTGRDVAGCSDIDLAFRLEPGRSYFDVGAFLSHAEELLGHRVDHIILDGTAGDPAWWADTPQERL